MHLIWQLLSASPADRCCTRTLSAFGHQRLCFIFCFFFHISSRMGCYLSKTQWSSTVQVMMALSRAACAGVVKLSIHQDTGELNLEDEQHYHGQGVIRCCLKEPPPVLLMAWHSIGGISAGLSHTQSSPDCLTSFLCPVPSHAEKGWMDYFFRWAQYRWPQHYCSHFLRIGKEEKIFSLDSLKVLFVPGGGFAPISPYCRMLVRLTKCKNRTMGI